MLVNDIIRSIHQFEFQTLASDNHPDYPRARINVEISDMIRSHAIAGLFKHCNPNPQKYVFIAARKDIKNFEVRIITHLSKNNVKVDSAFLNALKKSVVAFALTLATCWEKDILGGYNSSSDIKWAEEVYITESIDEIGHIFDCVKKESGANVIWEQVEMRETEEWYDALAGTKKEIFSYIEYLKKIGTEINSSLGV